MSTTGRVTRIGRSFFAISIVAFGIQQFVYTGFLQGLALVPEWVPAHALFAYLAGTVLITAGVCVAIEVEARAAASLLGLLLLMCVLFLHGPRIGEILRDIVERTRAFETLALCAAAFIIAGTLPRGQRLRTLDGATNEAVEWAPFCLAVSLAIFASITCWLQSSSPDLSLLGFPGICFGYISPLSGFSQRLYPSLPGS